MHNQFAISLLFLDNPFEAANSPGTAIRRE
jgi:hypothetical protein